MGLTVPKLFHTNQCIICLGDFPRDETTPCIVLKCGHIFDEECGKKWLKRKSNCPLCEQRTIVPLLLREIAKDSINKGIAYSQTAAVLLASLTYITIIALAGQGFMNYLYPNLLPHTPEEFEAIKADGGTVYEYNHFWLLYIAGSFAGIIALSGTIGGTYSFLEKRHRSLSDTTLINYTPPADLEEGATSN